MGGSKHVCCLLRDIHPESVRGGREQQPEKATRERLGRTCRFSLDVDGGGWDDA